ncbi:hypothetical protein NBRC110019_14300 [Neptunitalea chrysea]|uniref:Phytase-like domain-containing protein n=2 Tax=Neptunitalea chrysea TaxID=1647581 RepID=A0A9W6B4I9_9FLAO|nr:hypothetical protein NBRC110019_14300 [Neptunitalea chrysea]
MSFSQDVQLQILDNELNKPFEFSSLAIRNDTIFLPTENCKTIFYVDKITKKVIGKDYFEVLGKSDLEGITVFKNYIFVADEEDNNIQFINITTKAITKLKIHDIDSNQNTNHDFGLEGIKMNKKGTYLYVLKELNKNYESEIYCFNVTFKNNLFFLALDKKIVIRLDRSHRYTDLALSEDETKLYLLRSKIGGYYIDHIDITNLKSTFYFKDLATIDISKSVNTYSKLGYNSNMEGLAVDGNSLYLISDNYNGRDNTCDDPVNEKSKTLFLEVKL